MGSANAMEYIIRQLQDAGAQGLGKDGAWYQDFPFGDKVKVTARNVLGVFPGKGALADEAVIVSAHHDHLGTNDDLVKAGKDGIFNGADDNASGCAAILLVARALGAERSRLPASYRTVIFASFDAEEQMEEDPMVEQLRRLDRTIRKTHKIDTTLQEQLAQAVANEQYETAAELRDKLRRRQQ